MQGHTQVVACSQLPPLVELVNVGGSAGGVPRGNLLVMDGQLFGTSADGLSDLLMPAVAAPSGEANQAAPVHAYDNDSGSAGGVLDDDSQLFYYYYGARAASCGPPCIGEVGV